MAAFHGKRGSGTFAGLTLEIFSWTVDATADTVDVTVMDVTAIGATVHWKEYVIGFKDWTATIEVVNPIGGIGLAALATESELLLETTEGKLYKGNAICTGIGCASGADAAGTTTLTFQGTDQLEEAA